MLRRVYWPGIHSEVKTIANTCESCQEAKPRNFRMPLIQHNKGASPLEKVATDLFEIQGRHYMVTVDFFANFIEVDFSTSLSAGQVITKLKGNFARYGVPKMVVTDSGTQFTAGEFTAKWGIHHVMSTPGYHQAKGKAKSAVKIVKRMMRKAVAEERTSMRHYLSSDRLLAKEVCQVQHSSCSEERPGPSSSNGR